MILTFCRKHGVLSLSASPSFEHTPLPAVAFRIHQSLAIELVFHAHVRVRHVKQVARFARGSFETKRATTTREC